MNKVVLNERLDKTLVTLAKAAGLTPAELARRIVVHELKLDVKPETVKTRTLN